MKDLSIIIPARNEIFLAKTIENILENIEADTEIIAVLDGYWPDPYVNDNPRVTLLHFTEPIGQRMATNLGVQLSRSKYMMKCDAHCSFDKGFDRKLMEDCEYNWTVIPRMYNLHAFDWKCSECGWTQYQGPKPDKCEKCGNTNIEMSVVWKPRWNRKADFALFNFDMRFKYWNDYKNRVEAKDEIADVMCSVGACWFMHRDRYLEIDGLDEDHGTWGQVGVELACKSWLSGGRQVVNKKTWFAHMFRTQDGFSWPYPISGKAVDKCRKYSQDLWKNNKWPKQKKKLSWLIDKFSPVPTWVENDATILYYTANKINNDFATRITNYIKSNVNGMPIISISQKPIDFGENICVGDIGQSYKNVYKQILLGALEAKTKYVICCEDDILYTSDYFNYRPQIAPFAYNLNRWNLHTTKDIFSFTNRIIMGQCIAEREALIECLTAREKLENYPDELVGEPGRFEKQLGLKEYKYETFETEVPNIQFVHDDAVCKRKRLGNALPPTNKLDPWGEAKELIDSIYTGKKKLPFRRHSKYCYIKQYVFKIDELVNNRLDYIHKEKAESQKWFLKVYPTFVEKIKNGEIFTNESLQKEPYFEYLISKLHRSMRDPLTERGKRHVLNLMKESIRLFHDIKDNGLKAPLDTYIEDGRLVLHRGERRLEILKQLGRKRIPARVFKDKDKFNKLRPKHAWSKNIQKGSIHEIAVRHFAEVGEKCTDKYWNHEYTLLYDKEFAHLRDKKFKLLEIGVKKGASLKLWKEAFPDAEIYGIDKDDEGVKDFKIFYGNQQDNQFLIKVIEQTGNLDIIIDDGSHKPEHQKASFDVLWQSMNHGGIYVIEDLHHSYRENGQMVNELKKLIDNLYTDCSVSQISFYYNICFIRKN